MNWPTGIYVVDALFWLVVLALAGKALNLAARAWSTTRRKP